MIDIKNTSILGLLPPSITNDSQVKAAAMAVDKELQAVNQAIDKFLNLSNLKDLPETVIDLLAWENHVDFYDPDLPIEVKHVLVKQAIPWHRRKGTPAAVEELITTVFGEGKVVEWFEYGGEPYRFKVVTSNHSVTGAQAAEFIRLLNSVKNTRSWLDSIEITVTDEMPLYFAGVLHMGDNLTIEQVV